METNILKRGGQARLRGGCLKKTNWNRLTSYEAIKSNFILQVCLQNFLIKEDNF